MPTWTVCLSFPVKVVHHGGTVFGIQVTLQNPVQHKSSVAFVEQGLWNICLPPDADAVLWNGIIVWISPALPGRGQPQFPVGTIAADKQR
jgi:hypothetical protein